MSNYKSSTFEQGSLRDVLKNGTRDVHSVADKLLSGHFVKGGIDRATYRHFLAQLYYLYDAMEEELARNATHPLVGPAYFPDELDRRDAIEIDLEFYYGPSWRDDISCLASTRRYVERVREVGRSRPELLNAHAYVRYLGDVSGGQIIKKIMQRLFALSPDGEGIEFYEFRNVASIPKFKEFYNARMNSLELSDGEKQDMVDEAVRSFHHVVDIFSDVIRIAEQRCGSTRFVKDARNRCPAITGGRANSKGDGVNSTDVLVNSKGGGRPNFVIATMTLAVAMSATVMMYIASW